MICPDTHQFQIFFNMANIEAEKQKNFLALSFEMYQLNIESQDYCVFQRMIVGLKFEPII
jgi:hypothetical protein